MGLPHFIDTAKVYPPSPYLVALLDLKGAYDRVQRPLLWQVLQRLGIHGKMLADIQSLYKDSQNQHQWQIRQAHFLYDWCQARLPSQPNLVWVVCRWSPVP